MKKRYVQDGQGRQGQSLVEFALMLPLLLILILGMIEVGAGMYSYIRLASANREGVRMASRGRFEDPTIAVRVVAAGGASEPSPGVLEPYLRMVGSKPNTGMILTYVTIPLDGGEPVVSPSYVSGTLAINTPSGPVVRPITQDDRRLSKMTDDELLEYLDYRREVSSDIRDYRDAEDYDTMDNEIFVIVETYYAHELITKGLPFIDDPMSLYIASTMRVMSDAREGVVEE